jgi:O-6-methylguanine DNA methyltransferase
MYVEYFDSFLGTIEILADEEFLLGVHLVKKRREPAPNAVTMLTAKWLREYFAKKCPGWTPPLRFKSEFGKTVSEAVMEIECGKTESYSQVAARIGRKGAQRAVAQIMKHNPYMIIVPCHRVVAKNSLGGYNGGIDIKKRLLEFEGAYR